MPVAPWAFSSSQERGHGCVQVSHCIQTSIWSPTYLFRIPLHNLKISFLCIKDCLSFVDQLARHHDFWFRHVGGRVSVFSSMRGSCRRARATLIGTLSYVSRQL